MICLEDLALPLVFINYPIAPGPVDLIDSRLSDRLKLVLARWLEMEVTFRILT